MEKRTVLAQAIGSEAATQANCERCPLRKGRLVPPELRKRESKGRPIVLIGEAPGKHEIVKMRPFVGPSGKLMMRGFQRVGSLAREQVHWTNAVLCSTERKGTPKDDQLVDAMHACENRLIVELENENLQKAVVVTAGGASLAAVIDRNKPITRWRGTVGTAKELERNFPRSALGSEQLLAPILHPAHVFRSPGWRKTFGLDLERVFRLTRLDRYQPPEELEGRTVVVAWNEKQLKAELAKLGKFVGFDVETDRAEPLDATLVCFGISDGKHTVVVPWGRYWSFPGRVAKIVSDSFAGRTVITHNGPAFDHIVGLQAGIEIRAWEDTILMAHSLRSHLPKNLQSVATHYLDVPPWKELEDRTADRGRLYLYNARDTLYTALVGKMMEKEMKSVPV